jgi:hypothetical protein
MLIRVLFIDFCVYGYASTPDDMHDRTDIIKI